MSNPLKIGPKSAAWLRQIGVRTHEDLAAMGAVEAYVRCKRAGFRPSLNMLYSLEGALLGCHWQKVPEERRTELLSLVESKVAQIQPSRGRAAALVVGEVRDLEVEHDAPTDFGYESDSLDSNGATEEN